MDAIRRTLKQYRMPVDDEGYICAVDPGDVAAIQACFDKYGVVVVGNVLTSSELTSSVAEVWSGLQSIDPTIDPSNPSTFATPKWPPMHKMGILGSEPALTLQMCHNRQNLRLHSAFAAVFRTERLLVDISRVGFMRPAGLNPTWGTMKNWLHLDMNPVTGLFSTVGFQASNKCSNNSLLHTQGILALSDCPESVGGFHAVPGFHHVLREWSLLREDHCLNGGKSGNFGLAAKTHSDPTTVQIPQEDTAVWKNVQRMPIRKGSLLIWNNNVAHANFPSVSVDGVRIVQYIRMARADDEALRSRLFSSEEDLRIYLASLGDAERILLQQSPAVSPVHVGQFPSDFAFTPVGRKLYGLDSW